MLAFARIKTVLAAMRCHETWTLPPRVSRTLFRALFATRPSSAPSGTLLYVNGPAIGTRSFGRYVSALKRLKRCAGLPLVAHLSVTDRCVNRCDRCSNLSASPSDPSLASLLPVIARLREAGTVSLAFTGGEPLLRDDLPQLVAACGKPMTTFLFTTGFGLDTCRARELRRAGLTAAFVSLDHYRAEEHDRIRGSKGAFDQAVGAIRACIEAGIYTAAQSVVEPAMLVKAEMDRFLGFCRSLGVHEVNLLEPMPVRSACHAPSLDEGDRDMLRRLHVRAARDSSLPKVTTMPFLEGPEFLGCQAGFTFLYVSAGGEVYPCDFAPISFGNIHETDFGEILSRLRRHFAAPSCKCLALRLPEIGGESLELPCPWERTETLMKHYDPGEPPALMKAIL